MQIVIDIDKDIYFDMKEGDFDYARRVVRGYQATIADAIRNGTPLPKGHGRLKDVDAFLSKVKADREHSAYLRSWTADDVLNALDNSYAPIIVEAESEK